MNPETYAISKADLILKGERGGSGQHPLRLHGFRTTDSLPANSTSCFPIRLMGRSWKTDLERMGGKSGLVDMRFIVEHADDPDYSLVTRSSDGQDAVPGEHAEQDEAGHAAGEPDRGGA